jgi:hypothetical protein
MAFLRVGAAWPNLRWQEFANVLATTVRAFYRIGPLGAGPNVPIALWDNSYETSEGSDADGLNRHIHTFNVIEEMIGSEVYLIVVDATEDDQYLEFGPFDIISPAATSAVVSPSSVSVPIGRTRQFTAAFYAADGALTDDHDAAIFAVDGGGVITPDGLFTAITIGGPHTVTMMAGLIADTASVRVVKAYNLSHSSPHVGVCVTP